MKVMFLSDIHGSAKFLKQALNIFEQDKMDQIVLLGDLLYHGPRNPLPDGYDCMAVANMLNQYKDKIIAVRGNCDSEVDQMVIEFDIMETYKRVKFDQYDFFLTHGHIYNQEQLPELKPNEIFIHGHFHVPMTIKNGSNKILNPSSISLPKAGRRSFGVYENGSFKIKSLENKLIQEIKL